MTDHHVIILFLAGVASGAALFWMFSRAVHGSPLRGDKRDDNLVRNLRAAAIDANENCDKARRQRDVALAALEKIAITNASKHGTVGMMLTRCMDIARAGIGGVKGGAA